MMRLGRNCAVRVLPLVLAQGCVVGAMQIDDVPEGAVLSEVTQLTTREQFLKAGEAYFAPDMSQVIFQAVPVPPEGHDPDPNYSMYVANLDRDEHGRPNGLSEITRISTPGSANTCGWFHPTRPHEVLWGSTVVEPNQDNVPGYQRGTGRYVWQFPSEMEICTWTPEDGAQVMFQRPGYTAEGSWSPDARHVLYTNVDEAKSERTGRADADIYVYDTVRAEHVPLVVAPGYDGGPFFSPDGSWICYRSDRRGDNLLQLFAAELEYDASGAITGVGREVQLTDNEHVNWAPYWHPSGRFMLYTTSEQGHSNYELYAIEFAPERAEPRKVRVTSHDRFDGLGVFSADGRWMMWTAQRSPEGSSQLWIARFDAGPILGSAVP